MAAALLEEGNNSPADVFLLRTGALGSAQKAGRSSKLEELLNKADARYRSSDGEW